jgi:DNA protecting protein DprA
MELISSKTRMLLALSMLKGVGPAALKKVATIADFWEMAIGDLSQIVPQIARAVTPDGAWMNAKAEADKQVAAADRHGARIVSPLDADYPRLLAETKDDPFLLYIKGVLAKDPERSVAVIGTREPTKTGAIVAQRVASIFVEQGWSIVSGLAIGCDAIAHQAALEAGGHTVAVLAHGLQMIAPSRHKRLAQEILEAGGALVSEYPFGQAVQAQQFVKRDRTQAGMAQGVVMIQSDVKGGSLHASRAALDYERWLAVPYPTPRDLQLQEPKVQGNLVIADGTDAERSALLRCPVRALARVQVLSDRIDILRLAGATVDAPDGVVESSAREPLVASDTGSPERCPTAVSESSSDERFLQSGLQGDGHPEDDEIEALEAAAPTVIVPEAPEPPAAEASEVLDSPETLVESETQAAGSRNRARIARTPGKSSVRYHVALFDSLSSTDLKIFSVPSSWIARGKSESRSTVRYFDFAVLASRLEHIQARVDDIKNAQASAAKSEDQIKSLRVQFFMEDALTHMKRACDDLARIESTKVLHVSLKASNSEQLTLLEPKEAKADRYLDLVPTLDQIVKALPMSAAAPSRSRALRSSISRGEEIDVAFHDLVYSFNGLVSQALGVDAVSDAGPSRDHADHTR